MTLSTSFPIGMRDNEWMHNYDLEGLRSLLRVRSFYLLGKLALK